MYILLCWLLVVDTHYSVTELIHITGVLSSSDLLEKVKQLEGARISMIGLGIFSSWNPVYSSVMFLLLPFRVCQTLSFKNRQRADQLSIRGQSRIICNNQWRHVSFDILYTQFVCLYLFCRRRNSDILPSLEDLLFYTVAEGEERIPVHKFLTVSL